MTKENKLPVSSIQQAEQLLPKLRVVTDSAAVNVPGMNRRPLFLGIVFVGLFIVAVLFWASTAKLSSAALAPGVVIVEGERKTLQHLEGGIVRRIFVHDGQSVSTGDVLVELDNTRYKAEVATLNSQRILSYARQSRLRAERDEAADVAFPIELGSASTADEETTQAMIEQRRLFASRQRWHNEKIQHHKERIKQLQRQVNARQGQYANRGRQLELLQAELTRHAGLRQQGLLGRDKMYTLEQREAELQGERNADLADIASTREKISEVALEITQINNARSEDADRQLQALQDDLVEINQISGTATDQLNRTRIVAPSSGTVLNLRVHTPGGVIKSGEPILDIVPTDAELVVDTRVETKDRDVVFAGLPAEIRFSAMSRRSTQPVKGEVISVSADRLMDERTGMPYYLARVAFREDPSVVLGGVTIHPGMQSDVLIVTGERTVLDYLLQPITRSVRRALIEE